MQPDEADAAHLWDMHRFATEVASLVEGMDYHAFVADWPKRRAVERCIEIVGEAASHVSPRFRDAHSEIPWRAITAQRNILAHQYGDIRIDAIWRVATIRVAELLKQVAPILRDDDPRPAT
jgi:uncharacterized protein with HEPN domain